MIRMPWINPPCRVATNVMGGLEDPTVVIGISGLLSSCRRSGPGVPQTRARVLSWLQKARAYRARPDAIPARPMHRYEIRRYAILLGDKGACNRWYPRNCCRPRCLPDLDRRMLSML